MYLTVQQVAERYAVSPEVVARWIFFGDLKAINVSQSTKAKKKRFRISEEALKEFDLARQNVPVPRNGRRKKAEPVIEFF